MNEGKKKLKDNLYFIYTFIAFFVSLCSFAIGFVADVPMFYGFGIVAIAVSFLMNNKAYEVHGDPRSED